MYGLKLKFSKTRLYWTMINRFLFFLTLPVCLLMMSCGARDKSKIDNQGKIFETVSLLGDTLYRPILPPEIEQDYKKKLEDTRLMYKANPEEETNIIWYGRRLAYLGRYNQAIEVYTNGLQVHPNSFQILRHRGHRYITLRQFDRAIADLARAAVLATGTELEIEPDGMPNKLDIPLTTTQWNIYYHLGLAYYLKGEYDMALEAYLPCYALSDNEDVKVAVIDWMYMTLNRLGMKTEAEQLIEEVSPDWQMIENDSYFERIMMYQGNIATDSLLDLDDSTLSTLEIATQGYGVANYQLMSGDTIAATNLMRQIVSGENWAAFGFIAAEADLARENL